MGMRIVKRSALFALCTALLVGAPILGCSKIGGSGESVKQNRLLAISAIEETHGWMGGVAWYAQKEVEKVAGETGWDYELLLARDASEQSRQIIELIERDSDCIVMLPMDGASLKTAAMSVQDAGIPLIIFDREIPDFAPTATVKGDNKAIGGRTAELFNSRFAQGCGVLEFMGDISTPSQQRTDGYDEVINANFTKEQVGYCEWQRDKAQAMLDEWVKTHTQDELDDIGAIFSHDDEITLGILDCLAELDSKSGKRFNNLRIIASSGGKQEMYRKIASEERYELISLTYPPSMVKIAIRLSQSVIQGQDYEEMMIMQTQEVNRRNVEDFIVGSTY